MPFGLSMYIKREILIAILKTTVENGYAKMEEISKESRKPRELIWENLKSFCRAGLLELENDKIIINSEQRLKIALKAISLGADVERTARFLTWSEFEKFSTVTFEANGFKVKNNYRFTWLKKRWEIDILGLREPIIISADCKHWHQKWSGAASIKAAKNQIERTGALAEASGSMKDKIGIGGWSHAYFIPIILSLLPAQRKFYEKTPIVPILQLRDFLENIIVHLDEINSFHISYTILDDFINKKQGQ